MKGRSITASAALLATLLLAATGRAAAPGARVHLVGAGDGAPALEARLHDLLDDEVTGLIVDTAPTFHADDPLRTDDAEATTPTAWLVLEGTHARLRAAGAGRARFVFRDLEIGQPLTEFDSERLGQSVKAALGTLIAGGPGLLSREDAAVASGVALVVAPPPPPAVVAAVELPSPPAPRFRLGAFYQAEAVGNGLFHGPGLIATWSGSGRRGDPELWLNAGYDIPNEFGNQLASLSIDALWARAGLSLRWSDSVRVGAGVGIDRQTTRLVNFTPDGGAGNPDFDHDLLFVGRLLARVGPTRVAGIDMSVTAFLDISRSIERDIYAAFPTSGTTGGVIEVDLTVYRSNVFRPGLSLDLWWR
ncbi:MAG TPA: hypothetical protein VGP07_24985 [Polyangia bacterium]